MKIVCPACERVAEILAFQVDGSSLHLTCAKCGTQSPVQLAQTATLPTASLLPSAASATPDPRPESAPTHEKGAPPARPAQAVPAETAEATGPASIAQASSAPSANSAATGTASSDQASSAPSAISAATGTASTGHSPSAPSSLAGAARSTASSAHRVVALRPVTNAVQLAAEAAKSQDPFAVPEDHCPKCVGERPPDALFCPHCGLAWANFRPDQVAVPDDVAQAFVHALAQWDDAERHEALLALASRQGELPAVGRLYRLRLVAAPTDPIAQRGRDEVLRRAAAASEVLRVQSRPPAAPTLARWALIAVALMILFGAIGLVLGLLRG